MSMLYTHKQKWYTFLSLGHFKSDHNLLDFHFLVGNAVSVELCRNVFCLSHPRHHFSVLLRPFGERRRKHWNKIISTWIHNSIKLPVLQALPLRTGWSLDVFLQQLFISRIQQNWQFKKILFSLYRYLRKCDSLCKDRVRHVTTGDLLLGSMR